MNILLFPSPLNSYYYVSAHSMHSNSSQRNECMNVYVYACTCVLVSDCEFYLENSKSTSRVYSSLNTIIFQLFTAQHSSDNNSKNPVFFFYVRTNHQIMLCPTLSTFNRRKISSWLSIFAVYLYINTHTVKM